ncbi:fluoride efflux transporter FluC [Parafrigoribacterium soli]|uniref:fluoride efflux transporter FluC n=1 Tax=Parafrigoribacterium soli TaxID=3144663 RepID=UPI0032EAA94F
MRMPWRGLELPVNSDAEVARTVVGVSVMIRLRPGHLGLAALGGAAGTLARYAIVSITPSWETLSAGTVVVNILGPFMLGVLLKLLSEGTESRRRRAVQLFAGVGFLGAFTSYAQLAVDTVTVSEHGHVLFGIAYAAATIAAGALVAWLGVVAASRRPTGLRR